MKTLRRSLLMILIAACLLPVKGVGAETNPEQEASCGVPLERARVIRGVQMLNFDYPAICELEDFGNGEASVQLDDHAAVAVILLEEGTRAADRLLDIKTEDSRILPLRDSMQVLAYEAFVSFGLKIPLQDVVMVGLELPDGRSVIIQSTCTTGDTDIYDVLRIVVASVADVQPLADWLDNAWLVQP